MKKPIYFCKLCNETGNNNNNLDLQYFTSQRLEFRKGYIYEKTCKGNTSVCPYCDSELIKADISEEDYILLGKATNNNRQLLDAMVDLHNKDVIEYELKMSQFRNQYEQSQRVKKQEQESYNIPKCPTCNSTNITRISATAKAINAGMFGLLGNKRKKTFHCKNCKYEW